MGSDLDMAWPSAEIAVMGAKGAVEILHRRETPERREELERDYDARFLNPYVAADRGSVDAVIDPADTRREVAARSEEHTSELQSLMRISYAVFCLKKKTTIQKTPIITTTITSILVMTNSH